MGNHLQEYRDISRDSLSWVDFGFQLLNEPDLATRQKKTVKRILSNLYGKGIPGMILGDEVGMGKTYVALGIIAAVRRHIPSARIVVLTHSTMMSGKWLSCWKQMLDGRAFGRHSPSLPDYEELESLSHLSSRKIFFGSYETFKRVSTEPQKIMLERVMSGRHLREKTKRMLRKQIFDTWAVPDESCSELRKTARADLDRIWCDYIDRYSGWSCFGGVLEKLRRLVYKNQRTKHGIDLLVIDEAHKLEAHQRHVFFEEVLGGRADRALYLTATPFAMDIGELFNRIKDIHLATGQIEDGLSDLNSDLEKYRGIVDAEDGLDPALKKNIEQKLGRYLVRSTWPAHFKGAKLLRRKIISLPAEIAGTCSGKYSHATLALETAFVKLQQSRLKAHRAVHRQTLCSSYSAIRNAAVESDTSPAWKKLMGQLCLLLPSDESPKLVEAVRYLCECAEKRKKVLVFANRIATIEKLAKLIKLKTVSEERQSREIWGNISKRLKARGENRFLDEHIAEIRLAIHSGFCKKRGMEKWAINKLQKSLTSAFGSWDDGNRERLNDLWGRGRHAFSWVEPLTGKTRKREGRGRSKEDIVFSFNLPGPPYILICSNIAGEGIDLHRYCRRVMHYDLEWNPGILEQKVGRIDRINSLSQREVEPVETIYVWQKGTYEERMAERVQHRLLMMRTLLGAGNFLSDDPETQRIFDNLGQYELSFEV